MPREFSEGLDRWVHPPALHLAKRELERSPIVADS